MVSKIQFGQLKGELLFLVARQQEERQLNRLATGAYAGIATNGKRYWGYGACKNSEVLFAHGISHVLDDVHVDKGEVERLEIFVLKDGFRKYLTDYMPKWIERGGLNSDGKIPDDYEVWKRFYLLEKLSTISIGQMSRVDAREFFAELDEQVERLTKIASERGPFECAGIADQGIGWG